MRRSSGPRTRRSADVFVTTGAREGPTATPDNHVRIYEVGPRDGLQNEASPIPLADKLHYLELLVDAGLREIEATSFVAPSAIPQLADSDELMSALPRRAMEVHQVRA